jgi:hypothetical protein
MAEKLSARPGWAQLRRAADDLHVAELLLGDPLAPSRTAVPHLRDFWRGMVEVGRAARLGKAEADTPGAWLEGELPGYGARARERLRAHLHQLEQAEPPSDKQLKAHARAARELVSRLEPVVGGTPLYRRRRRILWTCVGLVILFAPVLTYLALRTEVEGEGPWRASYFTDRKLESNAIVQREANIVHDWGKDAPLEAVPPDKFSVRWDTCLRVDEATTATLQVNANDAARVFVDGAKVVDAWERDPVTRKRGFGSGQVELAPGVHHLRVEYFESLGTASIRLAASFGEELPGPLPSERLLYPGDELDEEDPCAAVR